MVIVAFGSLFHDPVPTIRDHGFLALLPARRIASAMVFPKDFSPAVIALQQVSRGLPIVFVGVVDPVGSGLVRRCTGATENVPLVAASRDRVSRNGEELFDSHAPLDSGAASRLVDGQLIRPSRSL
jgi:hypothetical protein